jgi:hypothetical protein
MAKAHYELQLAWQGKGSLGKAADDEPDIILRGQVIGRWTSIFVGIDA